MNVMIVDDDRDLAEGLAELLELHGHVVTIAGNGQEAVDRSLDSDFDLTFMDVRMPVMNGVDGFFAIRQIKPGARIVMMTGYKEDVIEKALEAGAIGVLSKPFPIKQMLDKIESVTDSARPGCAVEAGQ
jgi:two-component system sensor histidine kinase RpfC